jgi:hypothetical protein
MKAMLAITIKKITKIKVGTKKYNKNLARFFLMTLPVDSFFTGCQLPIARRFEFCIMLC